MAVKNLRNLPPIDADERTILEWRRSVQDAVRYSPIYGSGAPTVDAPVGTLYVNIDGGAGSTLYVKELAGTGAGAWAAK
jgi:hypothetical protein